MAPKIVGACKPQLKQKELNMSILNRIIVREDPKKLCMIWHEYEDKADDIRVDGFFNIAGAVDHARTLTASGVTLQFVVIEESISTFQQAISLAAKKLLAEGINLQEIGKEVLENERTSFEYEAFSQR
jgi:hypothetical protein